MISSDLDFLFLLPAVWVVGKLKGVMSGTDSSEDNIGAECESADDAFPLHEACDNGEVDVVVELLRNDPEGQVLLQNSSGELPLHVATRSEETEIIEILLQIIPEKQVLHEDKEGWIPLEEACLAGNTDVIEFLLRYEPEKQVLHQREDRIPLETLSVHDHREAAELLLTVVPEQQVLHQNPKKEIAFVTACQHNAYDLMRLLLTHVPQQQLLHSLVEMGVITYTPLLWAIRYQNLELVKVLLECQPEFQLFNKHQDLYPIHFACSMNGAAIVELLLQFSPERQVFLEICGMLPMHYACRGGSILCAQLLLPYGPERQLLHEDEKGHIPMYYDISGYCRNSLPRTSPSLDLIECLLVYCTDQQLEHLVADSSTLLRTAIDEHRNLFNLIVEFLRQGVLTQAHLELVASPEAQERLIEAVGNTSRRKSARTISPNQ